MRWLAGGSLIRRFAILSFLVVALTTVALSVVISSALRDNMLAREWHVTAGYIRLQAQAHLSAADFADPHSSTARVNFSTFYREVMRMPEIVRVKLYDHSKVVVWSDEARLIGQRFAGNPQLGRAVRGATVAHLETDKKSENVFENPRLVELYVPVELEPATGVTGIVETYKTTDEVFANIHSARRIVVATALAGGALLWTSLFGLVRAAARRLEHQHRVLAQRTGELTAANEELHRVQTQLVAAGRLAAMGEVVTAVAHGIRNPLANIRASAQVALLGCRDCGDARATAAVNVNNVIGEVDRLASRVTELLRFVRPGERRATRVDLNTVLRESLRSLRGRLATTKVDVVERLTEGLPVVTGDPVLLEQAFGGILENALDAMADGPGTLTIVTGADAARADGVWVVAEVSDTGSGIRPEDLGKVFELFFTTKSKGTGLGLALATKFIEAYGGTLTVTSEPGHGAVFRAAFPAAVGA